MYPLDPPNAITLGSIYVNLRLLYEESDYVLVRVRTNIGGSIGYAYNWSILMTKTVRVIRSMYLLGLSALNRSAPGRRSVDAIGLSMRTPLAVLVMAFPYLSIRSVTYCLNRNSVARNPDSTGQLTSTQVRLVESVIKVVLRP